MIRLTCALTAGVLLGLAGCRPAAPVAMAPSVQGDGVAVVCLTGVETGLATRAVVALRHGFYPSVFLSQSVKRLGGLAEAERLARELRESAGDTVFCIVALGASDNGTASLMAVTNRAVGIVDVGFLKRTYASGDGGEVQEKLGRWVEKETLRAAGMAIGMKECPNPLCAMSPYRLAPGTPVPGRNYCPPCDGYHEKALEAIGRRVSDGVGARGGALHQGK